MADTTVAAAPVVAETTTTPAPAAAAAANLSYNAKRSRVECDDDKIGMHVTILSTCLRRQGVAAADIPSRFKASTKDLYSDFVVREIPLDGDGNPLTLRTVGGIVTTAPPAKMTRAEKAAFTDEKKRLEAEEAAAAADPAVVAKVKADVLAAFTPIIGEEMATKMADVVSIGTEETFIVGAIEDKTKRGQFHNNVKALIGTKYISSTDNGQVVLNKATAAARREQDRRSNAGKPPKFLHFTLYKENTDNTSALRFIANHCGMSSRALLFGGTKDKRAVTLQRVACKGMDPARLEKVNRMSVSRNGIVRVGDYVEKECGLVLGELAGNHFTIALRIVDADVAEALRNNTFPLELIQKTLSQNGFINYFGPQRFGTTSILTSDVGRKLLKGEFKEAIAAILESRVEISPEAAPMLKAFTDLPSPSCYTEALANTPAYCFAERDLLKYLAHPANNDNFKGAFTAMQRTSVMMYFHAVQSWFWNEWVSRRLALKPMEPIVGDLVIIGGNAESLMTDDAAAAAPADGDAPNAAAASSPNNTSGTGQHMAKLHHVTQEDVDANRFTIYDVVMTVPGCDPKLQYPNTEGFMTKEKLMSEVTAQGLEGLFDPESYMAKQYHFFGTYRKMVNNLKDLKLSVKTYDTPSSVLIKTDLQKIKEEREAKAAADAAAAAGTDNAAGAPPQQQNVMVAAPQTAAHQGVAVIAEFSLPAGAYATCVLREFCETVRGTD